MESHFKYYDVGYLINYQLRVSAENHISIVRNVGQNYIGLASVSSYFFIISRFYIYNTILD